MMKKKALMLALCLMVVAAFAINAQAAFYTCTIQQAGTSSGIYVLQLTDTGATFPTPTYFYIDPSILQAKEMYAAALTAYSVGGHIQAAILNPTAWNQVTAVVCMP